MNKIEIYAEKSFEAIITAFQKEMKKTEKMIKQSINIDESIQLKKYWKFLKKNLADTISNSELLRSVLNNMDVKKELQELKKRSK
tara:strand:+ start:421 stop:675 length:255 start_codon:yes stop_codon:yes gene_type:complete